MNGQQAILSQISAYIVDFKRAKPKNYLSKIGTNQCRLINY